MDQKKIGRYIADKRRVTGLTQEELGSCLGVSSKAVSKWERGICLPDVGLYKELCRILEISLNEFFAGEDIDEKQLVSQSERNLMSVSRDGINKLKSSRKLIVLLAILLALLIAGSITKMARDGAFYRNYVEPYTGAAADKELAQCLGIDGMSSIVAFRVAEDITDVKFVMREYEKGRLVSEDAIFGIPDIKEKGAAAEGLIGIITDFNTGNVRLAVYGDNGAIGASLDGWELFGPITAATNTDSYCSDSITTRKKVQKGETTAISMLMIGNSFPGIAVQDAWDHGDKYFKDTKHAYVFAVRFE